VTVTGTASSLAETLDILAQARVDRDVAPHVLMFGVVPPCEGAFGGLTSQVAGLPNFVTADNAFTRIAAIVDDGSDFRYAVAHNIGFMLTRRHVQCSGSELGVDPNYPYEDGAIGDWGFGVVDHQFHDPATHASYMSFCDPYWASDYGWRITYPALRDLTALEP
jgi:hypothetical protein